MTTDEKTKKILELVETELKRARVKFPEKLVNQHEGYAIILEEVDELWNEVKKKQGNYDLLNQKKEAIQVAAMAVRFAVDLLYDVN